MRTLKEILKRIIFAPFAITTALLGLLLILLATIFSGSIAITGFLARKLFDCKFDYKVEVRP